MSRYPDYQRFDRNPDWERATPRELPRDTRYRLDPLPESACDRAWRRVESALSIIGYLAFAWFVGAAITYMMGG